MQQFFMLEFDLPANIELFAGADLLVRQQQRVREFMHEGRIVTYSSSENRFWAVVQAASEIEVLTMIGQMPLNEYLIPSITALNEFESNQVQQPAFATLN